MNALDQNDLLLNGTLPHDPKVNCVPYVLDSSVANDVLPSRPARSIEILSATDLARPLPPVTYAVPYLGIASGAPVLFAGYGYAGKTMALQSLALSAAAGKGLWGLLSVRRTRVLHLDYEQGHRITTERYQRLAAGMDVDLRDISSNLAVAVHPSVYLNDRDALEVYKRTFEGYGIVIVDSLKGGTTDMDENSSEARATIDLLGRAAEAHGTVVILIHHARKPKEGDPDGARYKIRGSSAIYDACSSVFVLSGEKGQPTRVFHEKCRNRGVTMDDFGLRVEDVTLDGDPRGGLRVVHLEAQQLTSTASKGPGPHARAMQRIEDHLRANGEYRGNKTGLLNTLRMNSTAYYGAFAELESTGRLSYGKDAKGHVVRWLPSAPESSREE
ncbi:MAG: AAA family ATPase [Polyangiaceae bacterium]